MDRREVLHEVHGDVRILIGADGRDRAARGRIDVKRIEILVAF